MHSLDFIKKNNKEGKSVLKTCTKKYGKESKDGEGGGREGKGRDGTILPGKHRVLTSTPTTEKKLLRCAVYMHQPHTKNVHTMYCTQVVIN